MKTIYLGLIFILTLFLSILTIGLLQYDSYTKDGDCYDKMNNKINGVSCDIEVYPVIENIGFFGEILLGVAIGSLAISIIFLFMIFMHLLIGYSLWD